LKLNYIEECILVAEKDYRTIEDKLNYVNARLRRVTLTKKGLEIVAVRNPKMKKPISSSTYYRKLGTMQKKARERGQLISKNYLFEVINEHDTLLSDRKELREIVQQARDLKKMQTVVMAKKEQIDIGRRILAVKELITTLMEEPNLEDEAQIERKIQLLTNS